MPILRGILGPHTFEDVPWHTHDFSEISGELVVSEAQITSLSASKLTSGEIEAQAITLGAGGVIKSSNFVTGPAGDGWQLSPTLAEFNNVTVRGVLVAETGSNIPAAHISAGTLDSGVINTGALNASNITTGTLSADFISGGTINATNVNVTNLNATNLSSGSVPSGRFGDNTVPGDAINVSTLSAITVNTGSLNVTGTLTMATGSLLVSKSSDARVEIGQAFNNEIRFYGTSSTSSDVRSTIRAGTSGYWIEIESPSGGYDRSRTTWSGGFTGTSAIDHYADAHRFETEDELDTIMTLYHDGSDGWVYSDVIRASNEVQVGNGAESDPSFTFADDGDTGIYRYGTNVLGITAGSSLHAVFGGGAANFPPGSSSSPGVAFLGDADSGFYRAGANSVAISTGGTWRFSVDTTRIQTTLPFYAPSGSVSAPTYAFAADTNTGLYRVGTDGYFAASVNGSIAMQWGPTADKFIYGLTTGATNAMQYNSGNGQITYVSSSRTIKKNIKPFTDIGLTDKLQVYSYKMRAGHADDPNRWHIGLIAEDTIAVDERFGIDQLGDLHPDADKQVAPANYIDRSVLGAVVADLQDARKRIAVLEERLEKLEALAAAA